MKVISVDSVWAWCIFYAGKDIENRDSQVKHRGAMGVRAKKTPSLEAYLAAARIVSLPPIDQLPCSCILGVVDVIDCVPNELCPESPWKSNRKHCLRLANPQRYDLPRPCLKAMPGIFEVDLEDPGQSTSN